MLEVIWTTLIQLFTGDTLIYLMAGVLVGLIVGILPALGTTAGMALVVPFVYDMEMTSGIAMMTGLLAVVATGDVVTSVLMGMPGGGSGSQATVLDGFPMAKKGEGARALSAAYFSSLLGGVFGALVLTGAILVARPIVLSFGTGELLLLVLLGLTLVSILSGPSLIKGFIACGIGMMLGAVGAAPATGEMRMVVFDFYYLADGLPLPAVALAVFALPEVIDLLRRGEAISERPLMGGGWLQGIVDTWTNRWLVLRCSVIGCIIGALPIGGSEWFAYGHAVQTCKPRDNFGKGDVRGVIAPEAANNANTGGALVPTLIFGIPGSGSTAIFLAGLILLGVRPGPDMVESQINVTYTIIWSLAIANVFGAGICFLISGQIARLATVRFVYVAPFLLTMIFFGAFQSSRQWGDLVVLLVVGTFAIFMRRFGYPRPALLIGFVLASHIEAMFYQTTQIYTLESLASRPLIWVLLLINVVSLYFGLKYRPVLETEGKSQFVGRSELLPQIVFVALIGIAVVYGMSNVWGLRTLGALFPLVAGAVTAVFVSLALISLLRGNPNSSMVFDSEVRWDRHEQGYKVGLFYYSAWIAGLMACIFCFGFILGIMLFFVLFLSMESKAPWWSIALMAISPAILLSAFSHFLVVDFPGGLLQMWLSLPWPLH